MSLYHFLRECYGIFLTYYRLIFLYPRKNISFDVGTNYDEYWLKRGKNETTTVSSWQRARADLAARIMHSRKGENLVLADIGAGNGAVATYLHSVVPGIAHVIAYDSSPLILEVARRSGIETVQVDLQNPDIEDKIKPCDYALLFEVIEHVPHSEKLVESALKKARHGIFISVPNTGFLPHRLRLLLGKAPLQWIQYPNEHLRFWTMRDMRWWLQALGLEYRSCLIGYKGVPLLRSIYPALFAAGLFVWIESEAGALSA